MFPLLSFVNHSCVPNVRVVDVVPCDELEASSSKLLVALRDLAPGEEVTFSYSYVKWDVEAPASVRMEFLRDTHGFTCACPACPNTAMAVLGSPPTSVVTSLFLELQDFVHRHFYMSPTESRQSEQILFTEGARNGKVDAYWSNADAILTIKLGYITRGRNSPKNVLTDVVERLLEDDLLTTIGLNGVVLKGVPNRAVAIKLSARGGWKLLHSGLDLSWLKKDAGGRQLVHCVFCGKHVGRHGNNPAPLAKGSCCDACNMSVVVQHRVMLAMGGR